MEEIVNIKELEDRSTELIELINKANLILNYDPIPSNVTGELASGVSRYSAKIGARFGQAISRGRIEEAIIGGAALGTLFVGAKIYDGIVNYCNKEANQKVASQLLAYYEELCTKHAKIIELQKKMQDEMEIQLCNQEHDNEKLMQQIKKLSDAVNCITAFKEKVTFKL